MTTVNEFLLERIAEDERLAEQTPMTSRKGHPLESYVGVRWMNFRMTILAECEAKRRIVGEHDKAWRTPIGDMSPMNAYRHKGQVAGLWLAVRLLALPYADHPDYREEWRP